MQISERTVGDVVIVDVSGKITLGDGGDVALRDKMRSLIQQEHKKVLLNLGDVSYVDSAGLGEIGRAYWFVAGEVSSPVITASGQRSASSWVEFPGPHPRSKTRGRGRCGTRASRSAAGRVRSASKRR